MPPGFPYGDKVVFVANDWHAGLVPSYIAGRYRRAGVYKVRALWIVIALCSLTTRSNSIALRGFSGRTSRLFVASHHHAAKMLMRI